ncbi:nicotinamide/nicotinic acid mononucleotide adenylyltransferase 1 isoform X2 [Ctenocephalides felis]|uniref:nicotinamide/nicotinic acid mononucleotide adenylyltransferase 1 isoform X2 n=1 Tax=Ctenocephalides felis TaxID=7515 RepID=UPI000E6E4AD5|nr:nicotinamide/nicotinic acid mononucleotide adenylyltransferase 1 isoform X2 [Ctenocephalides felis]
MHLLCDVTKNHYHTKKSSLSELIRSNVNLINQNIYKVLCSPIKKNMSNKVILLACGSFSPPTPMHFRMFELARDYLHSMNICSVIGGIASPVHDAYSKEGLAPSSHRCQMLKLALQSSDWIKLSSWECQQEGWSRTRVILQYHQNKINAFLKDRDSINEVEIPQWMPFSLLNHPEGFCNEGVTVKLLCGADLLESFATPGLWNYDDLEAILGDHGLVVITRYGSNPEQFIFNSDQLTKYRRNITIVTNWVPNEVSSSMIRRLLSRNESVKYLIDDKVIDYCIKNELYGAKTIKYNLTPTYNTNRNISSGIPSPADILMKSPSDFEIRLHPISHTYSMDETDFTETRVNIINNEPKSDKKVTKHEDLTKNTNKLPESKTNVFCCGETTEGKSNKKFLHPGQAVKVVTDSLGGHTVLKSERREY